MISEFTLLVEMLGLLRDMISQYFYFERYQLASFEFLILGNGFQFILQEYKEPLLTTYGLQGSIVDVILSKAEQILDIHKMFQIELADKVKNWDKEEEIGTCFIGFVSET